MSVKINKTLSVCTLILALFISPVQAYDLTKPVLIRPFGDSITFGVGFSSKCNAPLVLNQRICWPPGNYGGGYRGFLTLFALQGDSMVFTTEGYRSDGSYVQQWQTNTQNHDGYPGYTNDQLAPIASFASFADITLVHSGTNDIIYKSSAQEALDKLSTVLQNLLSANKNTHIVVAKIIPFGGQYPKLNLVVQSYNSGIPQTIAELGDAVQDRFSVVDMYTAIDPATDLISDGIHPNWMGYRKMACTWIAGIKVAATVANPAVTDPCVGTSADQAKKLMGFTDSAELEQGLPETPPAP